MSEKLYESYSCPKCGKRFDKHSLGKENKKEFDDHLKTEGLTL